MSVLRPGSELKLETKSILILKHESESEILELKSNIGIEIRDGINIDIETNQNQKFWESKATSIPNPE